MRLSDETLMAYADGELDESTRWQVELAMQADPAVAARVQQHMTLRRNVFSAFARTLDEPVPARLQDALEQGKAGKARPAGGHEHAGAPRPKVIQLDSVRAARSKPAVPAAPRRRWSWPEWGAMAATLVLGVGGGILAVTGFHSETQFAAVNGNGMLRAHGKLDTALSAQLASAPPPRGGVRIGVSFVGRDGQYCRSFELGSAAGLACRAGAGWNIPVLVEGQGGASGEYRRAGSGMPTAVLEAIDARAVGPSLDAAAEQAAAARGWSR